ncbi:SDR family oxidoreductase [Sphingobium sp.]|uniref:SDR family NAD(P)-dependent oxidoreductase n=1 Tax=Sphingobium sp. TaxID=1912891 RepID=UPI0028BE22C5|nr:SDR family oxidoreductase [Sphingobium sp.]
MTSSSLEGKVAFVTGADRNLGKAMATGLLRDGAHVVATAMYGSFLPQFVEESGAADRILALEGDISKDEDRQRLVQAALDRFGRVDILVNNAAVTPETFWPNFLTDGEPKQWTLGVDFYRNFLEIDCVAPHAFISAFVPGMLEAGWGRIINISTSVDTMLRFWPYGSAKAALDAQTAVLATQIEGTGVTANILGPGAFVKPAPILLDDGTVIRPDHGPEIMEAPVRWLASKRSSECNGIRVSAARWVADLPGDKQPGGAICPIDWTRSA